MPLAFYPGTAPTAPRLLDRFLPPLADGVAAHYVRQFSEPGDLVIDPYGTSPAVAQEALGLGRRVIVATLNPIARLALSLAVRPPAAQELRAALTRLGDAVTGRGPADRLERQVTALYSTTCAECEADVVADYYEWEAEAGEPVEKRYVCLGCGGARQAPTSAADREAAARFSRTGPDYHFLLGQVAGPEAQDREHAIEALEAYPARTLAAIGAILQKLDGLDISRETHRLLAGLLVAAFDAATVLGQDRPKALVTPRRYREVNFWWALEQAVGLLAGIPAPDRSMALDDLLAASGPGIHAFAGPIREAAARLPGGSCRLLLTALPRPNQALWTLSAVWSAWLWGAEAAEPIRAVLRRRRYDWNWHARALERTLAAALRPLNPAGRAVGLVAEAEPRFCGAVLAAGWAAGLKIEGTALRADSSEAQIVWRAETGLAENDTPIWDSRAPAAEPAPVVPTAMTEALRARAEPSRWSTLHFAAWAAVAGSEQPAPGSEDLAATVNREIEAAAWDAQLFRRMGTASDDISTGLWWLAEEPGPGGLAPLADRVEAEVRRRLQTEGRLEVYEHLPLLYTAFAGVETPGRNLVMACLASYADYQEAGIWQLRPEDTPEARAADAAQMLAHLRALGARHGFEVVGENPLAWQAEAETEYVFAVVTGAHLSEHLLSPIEPAVRRRFIVLPGGRAGLAEFKLRRDPRLRAAFTAGRWQILKYRQLRRMAEDAHLTRATLEPALAADPLEGAVQLTLLE